jgi:rhodanese-related sulfurtransferase
MPTRKRATRDSKRSKRSTTKSVCVACTDKESFSQSRFLNQKTEAIPAPWLSDLHRQAVPLHSQRFRQLLACGLVDTPPACSDIRVRIERSTPKLPARVLYWAASGCPVLHAKELCGAERAYGDYENMGIATRQGNALEFFLQTPRPYIAKQRGASKAQQWCRHVHFVDLKRVSNQKASTNNVLYTVAVFPSADKPVIQIKRGKYSCEPLFHPEQPTNIGFCKSMFIGLEMYLMAKANGIIAINAIKDPQWPPISEDDLVVDWHSSASSIQSIVKKAGARPESPLVVYCAKPKCTAAQDLMYKLTQRGYCNTYYFKGGMAEARERLGPLTRFLAHGRPTLS